jgi:hypothetical protein
MPGDVNCRAAASGVMQKKSRLDIGRLIPDSAWHPLAGALVVAVYCTTWYNTGDVLSELALSPKYPALMGCLPTKSLE